MTTEKNIVRHEEKAPEQIKQRRSVTPAVDIYENSKEILVVADIPGVPASGLHVNVENGELTIEANRSAEIQGAALVQGYEHLDYVRAFKVPNSIDTNKIDAQLRDGVLNIHLPKLAALQPRKIEVKVG